MFTTALRARIRWRPNVLSIADQHAMVGTRVLGSEELGHQGAVR